MLTKYLQCDKQQIRQCSDPRMVSLTVDPNTPLPYFQSSLRKPPLMWAESLLKCTLSTALNFGQSVSLSLSVPIILSMTAVDVDIYLISVKQFTFSSGLSLCTSPFDLRFFRAISGPIKPVYLSSEVWVCDLIWAVMTCFESSSLSHKLTIYAVHLRHIVGAWIVSGWVNLDAA